MYGRHMEKKLIKFLKALENRITPPPNCHHCLHYGEDDKLCLFLNIKNKFHSIFLDAGDLSKNVDLLVVEIMQLISTDTLQ